MNDLLEKLAALEHEQWVAWATSLVETETLSLTRIKRWEQYFIPYEQLPEEIKEHDRIWARKVLEVINSK